MIEDPNSRLTLKLFAPGDSAAIFGLIDANRAHLSQPGDITASKYPTFQSVLASITDPPNPNKLRYGIWLKETDTLVGSINLSPQPDRPTEAEVGYYLGQEFTGHGYATEALRLLTDYAFANLGLAAIWAEVSELNNPSQKVLEQAGYNKTERNHGDIKYKKVK